MSDELGDAIPCQFTPADCVALETLLRFARDHSEFRFMRENRERWWGMLEHVESRRVRTEALRAELVERERAFVARYGMTPDEFFESGQPGQGLRLERWEGMAG